MAVYFQPQYKPWWADLANTALKEGLSGLMKGMFERDAAARTKNRYNKEWAQAWEGYGGQPTGAQSTSAQQPASMSIESAPEVRGIGQIANPASMQSATGNDALGAALKKQGIAVPKEYLPNGNDGLLGTSIKANLANNYVQSQMPSREEFIRRLGMVMSPQNMELALKQADYMMGPRWKVDDQIYKGRQLENVLGSLPGMQDKEGNRNYNNRAYMYGMDNAANGNLNFLNPEYNRWFTEAENQKQRAFQAQEAEKSRAFTARQNAISHANQMALARLRGANLLARAMYGGKADDAEITKRAAQYKKLLAKVGGDELAKYDWKKFEDSVRAENPGMGDDILKKLSAANDLLALGEGDDMLTTTPTKPNPYAGRYSEPFTVPEFRSSGYRLGYADSKAAPDAATGSVLTEADIAKQYGKTPAQVQADIAKATRSRHGMPKEMAAISDFDVEDFMAAHPEIAYTDDWARSDLYNRHIVPPIDERIRRWAASRYYDDGND